MRIVSWNINGLRAVVSTQKSGGLQQLLHKLEADILCLQETKLTRAELTEKVSILPGWESFFDFCKTRTGYSGVATFCKDAFSPKAAERGITKNVMDDVMLDRLSEDEISALDAEGRCIATDHGAFVLFNVYMPALGCDDKFEVRPNPGLHSSHAVLRISKLLEYMTETMCDVSVPLLLAITRGSRCDTLTIRFRFKLPCVEAGEVGQLTSAWIFISPSMVVVILYCCLCATQTPSLMLQCCNAPHRCCTLLLYGQPLLLIARTQHTSWACTHAS
jgi:hypothetical protein